MHNLHAKTRCCLRSASGALKARLVCAKFYSVSTCQVLQLHAKMYMMNHISMQQLCIGDEV